ncbi:cytochrome c biogenesis CcdA family protein [Azohydromonas sediminis]|uniref:cytochrome c biogenesis CcdA family protein n=1 Tax=Azohydromonas sediminis TaxID=2259674 RepID=UPI000E648842|nr:cytochrome c biogenesis protein CcdA [Azohydromonas sediminis]
MTDATITLAAAFAGGLLTSASPCALVAVPLAVGFVGGQATTPTQAWRLTLAFVGGMVVALTLLGLAAARLGLLMGALPGAATSAFGVAVAALGVWMLVGRGTRCAVAVPPAWQRRLSGSGWAGALALGALVGGMTSPCATPALAAALAVAGAGTALGASMWHGAALLAAYAVGHSALLVVAGAVPGGAQALARRLAGVDRWLPGPRAFGVLLVMTGLWWTTLAPWA